ncbi:MAG: hypothetical protein ACLRI7_10055 [Ruthenibacterium lactatiformans]
MKRMDAYQTLVARLQENTGKDGAVSALRMRRPETFGPRPQNAAPAGGQFVHAGACCGNRRKVTARLQQDGYAIENVIITDDTGYAIPVNLYLPDAEPGPHPAVVVSMGHGPGQAVAGKPDILRKPCRAASSPLHTTPSVSERSPFSQQEFERCFGAVPRISKRWIFTCRRAI